MLVNNSTKGNDVGENLCRFCLRAGIQEKISIFEEKHFKITDISTYTNVQIYENDGLPENACLDCVNYIKESLAYWSQIRESDKILRLIFSIEEPELPDLLDIDDSPVDFNLNDLIIEDNNNKPTDPLEKLILDLNLAEELVAEEEQQEQQQESAGQVNENISSKRYQCPVCAKIFGLKGRFQQHLTIHGDNIVPCPICGKKFKNMKYMNAHHKTHGEIVESACDQCEKKFISQWSLKKHKKLQHNEYKEQKPKDYLCHICSKSFGSASYLELHLEQHEGTRGNKEYNCEICQKRYKRRKDFKKHLKIHNEATYTCHICEKIFKQKKHLKDHLLIHSDQKKFSCPVCPKKFFRGNHMKLHMKIHTNERDIACPVCDLKFSQKCNMVRHLKVVHKSDETN